MDDYLFPAPQSNLIENETNNADSTLALRISKEFDKRNRLIKISTLHSADTDSEYLLVLDQNSNLKSTLGPRQNTQSTFYDPVDRTRIISMALLTMSMMTWINYKKYSVQWGCHSNDQCPEDSQQVYLLELSWYVVLNPVRAGIVKDLDDRKSILARMVRNRLVMEPI